MNISKNDQAYGGSNGSLTEIIGDINSSPLACNSLEGLDNDTLVEAIPGISQPGKRLFNLRSLDDNISAFPSADDVKSEPVDNSYELGTEENCRESPTESSVNDIPEVPSISATDKSCETTNAESGNALVVSGSVASTDSISTISPTIPVLYTPSPRLHLEPSPTLLVPCTPVTQLRPATSPTTSYNTLSTFAPNAPSQAPRINSKPSLTVPISCIPSSYNVVSVPESSTPFLRTNPSMTPLSTIRPTGILEVPCKVPHLGTQHKAIMHFAADNIRKETLNSNVISKKTNSTSILHVRQPPPPPPLYRGMVPVKPVTIALRNDSIGRAKLVSRTSQNSSHSVIFTPRGITKPSNQAANTRSLNMASTSALLSDCVNSSRDKSNVTDGFPRNLLDPSRITVTKTVSTVGKNTRISKKNGKLAVYVPNGVTMESPSKDSLQKKKDPETPLGFCLVNVRSLRPDCSQREDDRGNSEILSHSPQQARLSVGPQAKLSHTPQQESSNCRVLDRSVDVEMSRTPEMVVPDKAIDLFPTGSSNFVNSPSKDFNVSRHAEVKIEKEIIYIKDENDPLLTDDSPGGTNIEGPLESMGFNGEFQTRDLGDICYWKSCGESFGSLAELRTHVNINHLSASVRHSMRNEDYANQGSSSSIDKEPSVEKENLTAGIKSNMNEIVQKHPNVQCAFCKASFYQEKHLKSHCCFMSEQQKSTKEKAKAQNCDSEEDDVEEDPEIKYPCPICMQHFETEWLLECHIKKKHTAVLCKTCNMRVISCNILRHHREKHQLLKVYQCNICGGKHLCRRCVNERTAAQHLAYHSRYCPVVHFRCKWCESIAMSHTALKAHIKEFHEEQYEAINSDMCIICHLRLGTLQGLQRHYEGFHRKAGVCHECNVVFSSRAAFDIHFSLLHEKLPPYICFVCRRQFKSFHELGPHLRDIHGKIGYTCEQCKWFSSPPSPNLLKEHCAAAHIDVRNAVHSYESTKYRFRKGHYTTPPQESTKNYYIDNVKFNEKTINGKRRGPPNGESVRKKQKTPSWVDAAIAENDGSNRFSDHNVRTQVRAPFQLIPQVILHDVRESMAQCQVCSRIFSSKVILDIHMDVVHNIIRFGVDDNQVQNDDDDSVSQVGNSSCDAKMLSMCTKCEKSFHTQDDLILHVTSEHRRSPSRSLTRQQCETESVDGHLKDNRASPNLPNRTAEEKLNISPGHWLWKCKRRKKRKPFPAEKLNSFHEFYSNNILKKGVAVQEDSSKKEAHFKRVGLAFKDSEQLPPIQSDGDYMTSRHTSIPTKSHCTRSKREIFSHSATVNTSNLQSTSNENKLLCASGYLPPINKTDAMSAANGCFPIKERVDEEGETETYVGSGSVSSQTIQSATPDDQKKTLASVVEGPAEGVHKGIEESVSMAKTDDISVSVVFNAMRKKGKKKVQFKKKTGMQKRPVSKRVLKSIGIKNRTYRNDLNAEATPTSKGNVNVEDPQNSERNVYASRKIKRRALEQRELKGGSQEEDSHRTVSKVLSDTGLTYKNNERENDAVSIWHSEIDNTSKEEPLLDDEKKIRFCGYIEDLPFHQPQHDSLGHAEKDEEKSEDKTVFNTSPHISVLAMSDEFHDKDGDEEEYGKTYKCYICCQFSFQTWEKLEHHMVKCTAKNIQLHPHMNEKDKKGGNRKAESDKMSVQKENVEEFNAFQGKQEKECNSETKRRPGRPKNQEPRKEKSTKGRRKEKIDDAKSSIRNLRKEANKDRATSVFNVGKQNKKGGRSKEDIPNRNKQKQTRGKVITGRMQEVKRGKSSFQRKKFFKSPDSTEENLRGKATRKVLFVTRKRGSAEKVPNTKLPH